MSTLRIASPVGMSEPTSKHAASHHKERTPPPAFLKAEANIRRFLRDFVTTKLRESDHEDLADKLDEETERILLEVEDMKEMEQALRHVERSEEFDNMCERLCLSQHNARNRFRRTIEVLFNKGISWNNIVTMVTFTGHVAVFCADQNMEEQTVEVVEEADAFIHDRLLPWILEKGAWVCVCVCVCVCVRVRVCIQTVFRRCPYELYKMLMTV